MHRAIHELTQAIASGDSAALAVFYEQWFDWMYAVAHAATRRDEAFCLDVVQDSMLRVIKSIKRMETREDLERWLTTVIKRAAIDRMRHDSRATARDRKVGEANGSEPAQRSTTEEREWVTRAVRSLSPDDQELLLHRHQLGRTLAQIGAARGRSPGAVHGRMMRLLAMLRRDAKEAFDAT